MHDSMTVESPKGSKGLNAPIRRERPAASKMAATRFTSKLFRCGGRFPKLHAIAFGIHHPAEFSEFGFFEVCFNLDTFCAERRYKFLQIPYTKVDHEGLSAGSKVFGAVRKDRPGGDAAILLRILTPVKSKQIGRA